MRKFEMIACAVALCAFCAGVWGAALTAERNTPRRELKQLSLTQESNTTIYAGALVALNTSGRVINATDGADQKVLGRAAVTKTTAATATGTVTVDVGVFGWANVHTATDADIGSVAYVVDNASVSTSAGTYTNYAGRIVDVDSNYVWVETPVGGKWDR